jgi:RNA polymerase sigma factor (TIGR02999 family)
VKNLSDTQEVTGLLRAWSEGDQAALEELMPLVYEELRRLAKRYMAREQTGHTLQTTALVNEAYLRLIDARQVTWQNRSHFFAVSAQVMRHILVDFARRRQNLKRGGEAETVRLDDALLVAQEQSADLVALDDALRTLAALDPRQAQVVELRFFGGLSIEETATALGVSPGTVRRDWSLAQAWLFKEVSKSDQLSALSDQPEGEPGLADR